MCSQLKLLGCSLAIVSNEYQINNVIAKYDVFSSSNPGGMHLSRPNCSYSFALFSCLITILYLCLNIPVDQCYIVNNIVHVTSNVAVQDPNTVFFLFPFQKNYFVFPVSHTSTTAELLRVIAFLS